MHSDRKSGEHQQTNFFAAFDGREWKRGVADPVQIGMGIGLLLGLTHGVQVYRALAARRPSHAGPHKGRLRGLYYGLWTVLLWVLFGPYVVVIWVIGRLAYLVSRLMLRLHGERDLSATGPEETP